MDNIVIWVDDDGAEQAAHVLEIMNYIPNANVEHHVQDALGTKTARLADLKTAIERGVKIYPKTAKMVANDVMMTKTMALMLSILKRK